MFRTTELGLSRHEASSGGRRDANFLGSAFSLVVNEITPEEKGSPVQDEDLLFSLKTSEMNLSSPFPTSLMKESKENMN